MIYIYVDNNKQLFQSYYIMGAEISSNRDQADALDISGLEYKTSYRTFKKIKKK